MVAVARNFYVGFYVAGRNVSDHSPDAYRVELQGLIDRPRVERLGRGWNMNGSTALACRILRGWDPALVDAVLAARAPVPPAPSEQSALAQGAPALAAPLWSGSRGELEAALAPLELPVPPNLPIREAVDFVHFVVQATVKSLKFGRLPPGVGGPVELAIITSDRPFRWVKHKTFDAAL